MRRRRERGRGRQRGRKRGRGGDGNKDGEEGRFGDASQGEEEELAEAEDGEEEVGRGSNKARIKERIRPIRPTMRPHDDGMIAR